MKKRHVFATLAVLIAVPAPGFAKSVSGTETEILKAEQKLLEAALKGDAAVMQKMLADDYFGISAVTGEVATKEDSVKNYQTARVKYDSLTPSETKVHVYNSTTALVTAKIDAKGKLGDRDLSGSYRYSRLYVKRGGQWQVVAFQSTKIPGPGSS